MNDPALHHNPAVVPSQATPPQMQTIGTSQDVLIQPGNYRLGDPCYLFSNENSEWLTLLHSCGFFGYEPGPNSGPIGYVAGHPVLAFLTAHGDGHYEDQHGNTYPVDAGLIGLVPEALYSRPETPRRDRDDLGIVVTFDEAVIASADENGVLRFGSYVIDTDPRFEGSEVLTDDGDDDEDDEQG